MTITVDLPDLNVWLAMARPQPRYNSVITGLLSRFNSRWGVRRLCVQTASRPRSSRFRSASSRATRFLSRAASCTVRGGIAPPIEQLLRRRCGYDKNERRGESDEPDTPLLGEVDVVIGGEKSNQANNAAKDGFQQGLAVKPQPPPGRRGIQILKRFIHPKQPSPIPILTSLIHAYAHD